MCGGAAHGLHWQLLYSLGHLRMDWSVSNEPLICDSFIHQALGHWCDLSLGDGYCDDGTFGLFLDCPALNWYGYARTS